MNISEEMMRWVQGASQPLRELAAPTSGTGVSPVSGVGSGVGPNLEGILPTRDFGELSEPPQEPIAAPSQVNPPEAVVRFLHSQMNADGGFRGRGRASDLYYTVFALQGLAGLDACFPHHKLAEYLECFGIGEDLDLVHLCCLVRAWWLQSALVAARGESRVVGGASVSCSFVFPNPLSDSTRRAMVQGLEAFRTSDGGYAINRGGTASVQGAFMALGAYQDFEQTLPHHDALARNVRAMQTPQGGFANEASAPAASTPATAAAITLLRHLGRDVPQPAVSWLLDRVCHGGGFTASDGSPECDLRSTATALHAIHEANLGRRLQEQVQARLEAQRDANLQFVGRVWQPSGGFCGSPSDNTPDTEYTFYGLLALGHLA